MKKLLLTFVISLFYSLSFGQKIEDLYNDRNFNELIKFESKADTLTSKQLYMVGYAFFELENDNKAIQFYNKAIAKGPDEASFHFYKGLALRYLEKYEDAMKEIEIAIKSEPTNQEFVNEKGVIYYNQGKQDKALAVFEQAKKLPGTYPEPFFWVARIYHEKQDFNKALTAFYEAMDTLPEENSYYLETLTSIGQLEYTFTKDYVKSANAYVTAINIDPKNYALYPKLMKACNEAKEYGKADTVFMLMKVAYDKNELAADDMKFKNAAIDEYEWKGQTVSVYKYFVYPTKALDVSYKVYLLSKEVDKVERTFLVEKTNPNPDGTKHILCETDKKTGNHYTYPYGWKTDAIPLEDLKKAVGLVLDGKMKFGAATTH